MFKAQGALILIAALTLAAAPVSAHETEQEYQLTANGQGRVEAQPDYVELNMEVQAQAPTVPPAKQSVDEAVGRVLEALRPFELPQDAVSAGRITIQPQYDQPRPGYEGTGRLQGFIVTRDVVVRLRAMDRLADLIAAAANAGVNSITSVTYQLDESHEEQLSIAAQRTALESARRQAEAAAATIGARLGQAVTVQLSSPPVHYGSAMGMARAGGAA